MYAWIWRLLPFGLPGKLIGSVMLVGGAAAMLWFVVFPWADPWIEETLLPWNEGQLDGEFAPGTEQPEQPEPGFEVPEDDSDLIGPDGSELEDEHDLPYDTDG